MKDQLILENENAYYVKYEDQIFLPESPAWNNVEVFIKKIFSLTVDNENLMNSPQIEYSFELLYQIVTACPRLIDRYSKYIIPFNSINLFNLLRSY